MPVSDPPTHLPSAKEPPGPPHTLVYLHLPKTAGSTMGAILERHFAPSQIYAFSVPDPGPLYNAFVALPVGERARYRLIRGHMPFGIHVHVPGPMSYFTVLRDPVDRAISMFYQILRTPHHPLYNEVAGGAVSLDRFVFERRTFRTDNLQTRLLSGVPQAVGHITRDNVLISPDIGYGECPPELLERARANLESHFSVVGTTERLDETLVLLSRTFGLGVPYSRRRNVGLNRVDRQSAGHTISDLRLAEVRAFLAADNAMDLALWRYAGERVDRSWSELGSRRELDLRILRLANRVADSDHPVARGLRSMVRRVQRPQTQSR